jgi:16S rRNA (guanine1207-N2)-methyltransferase
MTGDRLSLALEAGMFSVPEGEIAVYGAEGPDDLVALPKDRITVSQRMKPSADALAEAGFRVGDPSGAPALSVVFIPRSKALARAWVAEAARITKGPVIIDGAKTDGIEGLWREARKRAPVSDALSKHHGKLAVIAEGARFDDWEDPGPRDIGGYVTRLGVFSADGVDPGSAALAEVLPAKLGPRVADLGAGWGYLSRAILERAGVEELHLVETDRVALDCARENVADPRALFHWADVTTYQAPGFDDVVMNPPFHQGRAASPELGIAFIDAARRLLKPHGRLWLVANRHLPYERALDVTFAEVAEIGHTPSFKLFRAVRPRKRRTRS